MRCSRQEVLRTELPYIFAFLGMKGSLSQEMVMPSQAGMPAQPSGKYADGVKWEGGKSTKTISFSTLKGMAEKDMDGFNRKLKQYARGLKGTLSEDMVESD